MTKESSTHHHGVLYRLSAKLPDVDLISHLSKLLMIVLLQKVKPD